MLIHYPSSLVTESRRIAGPEAMKLAETNSGVADNTIGEILASTCVEVKDAGPYARTFAETGKIDWNEVLKGDLVVGLLELRVPSVPLGNAYEFEPACAACDGKRFKWRVDLVKDFLATTRLKKLPASSREQLQVANRFETTATNMDGAERKVAFRLQTPKDDVQLEKLMRGLRRRKPSPYEHIASQVIEIEGVPKSIMAIHAWLGGLDIGEIDVLRAKMEAVDCGIDTLISVRCDRCNTARDVDLPFGPTFFRQPTHLLIEAGKLPKPKPQDDDEPPGDPGPAA